MSCDGMWHGGGKKEYTILIKMKKQRLRENTLREEWIRLY